MAKLALCTQLGQSQAARKVAFPKLQHTSKEAAPTSTSVWCTMWHAWSGNARQAPGRPAAHQPRVPRCDAPAVLARLGHQRGAARRAAPLKVPQRALNVGRRHLCPGHCSRLRRVSERCRQLNAILRMLTKMSCQRNSSEREQGCVQEICCALHLCCGHLAPGSCSMFCHDLVAGPPHLACSLQQKLSGQSSLRTTHAFQAAAQRAFCLAYVHLSPGGAKSKGCTATSLAKSPNGCSA